MASKHEKKTYTCKKLLFGRRSSDEFARQAGRAKLCAMMGSVATPWRPSCMWDATEALLKASLRPQEDQLLQAWVQGWRYAVLRFEPIDWQIAQSATYEFGPRCGTGGASRASRGCT